MNLVFVTGNKGKAKEAQDILGFPISIENLKIDEVQSLDIEYIVQRKAEEAYKKIQKPLIVDDAGLYITAWNGYPGPLVKFIDDAGGTELLLAMMESVKDRAAYCKVAIGLHDGETVSIFTGEIHGQISYKQQGEHGWGYDPIFMPDGYSRTFAELGSEVKNSISHRKRALEKLKAHLISKT